MVFHHGLRQSSLASSLVLWSPGLPTKCNLHCLANLVTKDGQTPSEAQRLFKRTTDHKDQACLVFRTS